VSEAQEDSWQGIYAVIHRAEAVEIAADKAEQSSKVTGKQPLRATTPKNNNSDEGVVVPATPPRPAGESQGGTTITLALRTPERLRPGPDLVPRASPSLEVDTLLGNYRPR
jgi:hypothetical protein